PDHEGQAITVLAGCQLGVGGRGGVVSTRRWLATGRGNGSNEEGWDGVLACWSSIRADRTPKTAITPDGAGRSRRFQTLLSINRRNVGKRQNPPRLSNVMAVQTTLAPSP